MKVRETHSIIRIAVYLLMLTLLLTACKCEGNQASEVSPSGDQPETTKEAVSFQNDVLPIFSNYCLQCHAEGAPRGGLDLSSYTTLMQGSARGPVIVAGDAPNSKLIQLVMDGSMPQRGPDLSSEQIQILIDWVTSGVLDN